MTDWDVIRQNKMSTERPDDWPVGVRAISIKGTGLFGIHEKTGSLFFDGKEVAIKKKLELNWYELLIAAMTGVGTFGLFALELGKIAGWWGAH